jgi:hypothetical protein
MQTFVSATLPSYAAGFRWFFFAYFTGACGRGLG